ncbi:hypothetical protein CYLTODRAFT_314320, partial [Cylindrobasidium torrendii FP15055 ss-10]
LAEKSLGVNLLDVIRLNYKNDSVFSRVMEAPKSFRNFVARDGLLYLKEADRELLCIPDRVVIDGRYLREIIISEAHSILAHLGAAKTRTYLRDHVWWST